jgi:hypothetical protein
MRKISLFIIIILTLCSGCAEQKPIQEAPISTKSEIQEDTKPTMTEVVLPTNTEPPPPTSTPELPTATPFPKPEPRFMHNMIYNKASDIFILFGGTSEVSCGYQSDTWSYNIKTKTWKEMNTTEAPPAGQGTMAYDAESDKAVLFIGTLAGEFYDSDSDPTSRGGGSSCIPHDTPRNLTPGGETWVYDYPSNEWTDMKTPDGPFGLQGTRMVYNSAADRIILFGGWYVGDGPHQGASSETWSYDFNSNTWIQMSPEVSPPGRMDHVMAYDTESDRVILWGGGGPTPMDVGDIWAYDLNENTWKELQSNDAPRQIRFAAMVYDVLNDRMLLYFKKEFWAYDYNNNQWTLLSDSPAPLGLIWHSLVYDTSSDLILTFGGGREYYQWTNRSWVYDPRMDEWTDVSQR